MMENTLNNDLYVRYGEGTMNEYAAIRDQQKMLLDAQARTNHGPAATQESLIAAMISEHVPADAAAFLVSIIFK